MESVMPFSWKKAVGISAAVILLVTLIVTYPGLHQLGVDNELRDAVLHQDDARVHSALQEGANARGFAWVAADRRPVARLMRAENPFPVRSRPQGPTLVHTRARGNQRGHTLLMFAADTGNGAIARDLLEHGAEVDARLGNGNTALFMCIGRRSEQCMDALIQYGANVNASNNDGLTPLHVAAKNDNVSIVGQLLAHNADWKLKDKNGLTPLAAAAKAHSPNACLLLLDWGADPADLRRSLQASKGPATGMQYQDENDCLLAWAASRGSLELVRRGWEHILPGGEGERQGPEALYQAVAAGHRAVVKYLLAKGVSPNSEVRVARKPVISQIPFPARLIVGASTPVIARPSAAILAESTGATLVRAPHMKAKPANALAQVVAPPDDAAAKLP
jgi:ankyrin repeat protein